MKEIIYIQAGNVSNHIGTHFWNTQESYFSYDDDSDPLVNHDISFREGLSSQNVPTFCPRVLLFDNKSNFGSLSKYNELYSDLPDPEQPLSEGLWNGSIAEYRQDKIIKSKYQQRLEKGEDEEEESNGEHFIDSKASEIRYWSDYNRVYYHPRSLQQVPDLPDWQASKGDWSYGKSVFERFDLDNSLNEESLRRFVEECDNFQGFQASFDNSSFGGFSVSFLESIRDEFAKVPVLAFPVLSGVDPSRLDVEDDVMRRAILQDAACICALNELATQSIPTKSPSSWRLGGNLARLNLDTSSIYQTSAVLSSHIESATLPLRLKGRGEGLSDICSHLNWAQNTRFSHLSGVLPVTDVEAINDSVYDFSAIVEPNAKKLKRETIVQRNVSRGLSIDQARSLEAYFSSNTNLDSLYLSSIHAPAYPLPSSFPSIILPSSAPASSKAMYSAGPTPGKPKDTTLLSTLRTTLASVDALRAYAKVVHKCVVRRYTGDDAAGLDGDEIKEMKERLEALAEAYAGDDENGEEDVDEGVGEDEDVE